MYIICTFRVNFSILFAVRTGKIWENIIFTLVKIHTAWLLCCWIFFLQFHSFEAGIIAKANSSFKWQKNSFTYSHFLNRLIWLTEQLPHWPNNKKYVTVCRRRFDLWFQIFFRGCHKEKPCQTTETKTLLWASPSNQMNSGYLL